MPPPIPLPDPYLLRLGALYELDPPTYDGFFYAEFKATPPEPAKLGSFGELPTVPSYGLFK